MSDQPTPEDLTRRIEELEAALKKARLLLQDGATKAAMFVLDQV